MKNILFALVLLIGKSTWVNSQHLIKSGWLIGGSTNNITLKINTGQPRILSGNISPIIGKTYKNQSVFGFAFPLSFSSQIGEQSFYYRPTQQVLTLEKFSTTSFSASFFYRKYYGKSKLKPLWMVDLTHRWLFIRQKYKDSPMMLSGGRNFNLGVSTGAGYFLRDDFNLELIAGYSQMLTNTYHADFTLQIGINFFLRPKTKFNP